MKKLTKIRLINWHYFEDETVEIKNNTLLTGQNATGKSTILDALQYILTAGDQGFNLAAHDHGGRSLKGYIRCKLGVDDQEYLRKGDVTSHIALEFHNEEDDTYEVIGTVMDYKIDIDKVNSIFYSTPQKMVDEMFLDGKTVLSITAFKKTKLIESVYSTKREAKTAFRIIFGSVNERFFNLIPKALAFKPISNVKDFIYQYLLEEKKIDVANIQESIRLYKDLEDTLKVIKVKIKELSKITEIDDGLTNFYDQESLLKLLLVLTSIDDNDKRVEKYEKDLVKVEGEKDEQVLKIKELDDAISIYDGQSRLLYNNLMSNDTFKNKEEIERQIQRLKSDIALNEEKQEKYFDHVASITTLLNGFKADKEEHKIFRQLKILDLRTISSSNFEEVRSKLALFANDLDQRTSVLQQENGLLQNQKRDKGVEYEFIIKTIKNLESKKLRYHPSVTNLKNEISNKIKKTTDLDVSVNVLAELLEITDPEWQPAIENYLNTQRFNLIVDPKFYDFALDVFDEEKRRQPLYGVGLVNTKKLLEFDTFDPKSLAAIITSNNVYAKRYVNMLLGNVIRCDNVHELENYRTAITRDSMIYNNFTVRQMNDQKIEKPFIGKNAALEQLKKYQLMERQAHAEYLEIERKIKLTSDEISLIRGLNLRGLVDKMGINITIENQSNVLSELVRKKSEYQAQSAEALEKEYEALMTTLQAEEAKRRTLYEESGKIKNRIENIKNNIIDLKDRTLALQEEFQKLKQDNLSIEDKVYEVYQQDVKKYKSSNELVNYYTKRGLDNQESIQSYEDRLKGIQLEYNHEHNFASAIGHEFMKNYREELDKLVRSNLVEYEDKVREAREDTEKLFKEDFISKLRSYILQAQDGVNKINDALRSIKFGEDQYEFIFPKSKEYSGIYDMVMCDEPEEAGPIVTPEFEIRYQQELDDLFENLSLDEVGGESIINKFTDYRTYMDYDIRITNTKGTSLFSRVSKEKSGGETQVPFYVSVIASFVQLYSANNKASIGIIIFDEAFDKMDANRIKRMMEFIKELPLQIIIAATPEKMEITNFVDTTLILHRNPKGYNSYVYSKIRK